mmetsp:Transcript_31876/g.75727  ORF Transcript_31876/g.75727 Transcript_31876/m.75727 type:complete len:94 (+) Transcript_31876:1899-2180(+)
MAQDGWVRCCRLSISLKPSHFQIPPQTKYADARVLLSSACVSPAQMVLQRAEMRFRDSPSIGLDRKVEEGLCQLMAYLWLTSQPVSAGDIPLP